MAIKVEAEIGGQSFSLEAGKIAEQADGAVLVRYGDTVVLATSVAKEPREGLDFFPMTIDYEERMYAAGKIPGGFIKRESRPSEAAILAMRLRRTTRTSSPSTEPQQRSRSARSRSRDPWVPFESAASTASS